MEFKVYQKELNCSPAAGYPPSRYLARGGRNSEDVWGKERHRHHRVAPYHLFGHDPECSHDIDSFDLEYLQHDLLDIMRKLVPDYREEHQYRHPGPVHAQFGRYVGEPGDFTSMNTDGHLRSVFFGRSETMTIKDGVLDGGEFAHIYFVDWDQVRARKRQVNVTVMGTSEDETASGATTGNRHLQIFPRRRHTTRATTFASTDQHKEAAFSRLSPIERGRDGCPGARIPR